jgi:hypothetical protein
MECSRISFFEKLDFPNPYESAKDLLTWSMIREGKLPPEVMFADFAGMPPTTAQGVGNTGVVSNAEDNASQQPIDAVGTSSKQLMSSIKI